MQQVTIMIVTFFFLFFPRFEEVKRVEQENNIYTDVFDHAIISTSARHSNVSSVFSWLEGSVEKRAVEDAVRMLEQTNHT